MTVFDVIAGVFVVAFGACLLLAAVGLTVLVFFAGMVADRPDRKKVRS